jgi:hypothetical protein
MTIFDLFSKRQKRFGGEIPDIYIYDNISQNLRLQIVHIIRDCIGKHKDYHNDQVVKPMNSFTTPSVENMECFNL